MKYLLIFVLLPFMLFAQSELVSNNLFAVEADAAFSHNNNFSGNGGDIGMSLNSVFDIGFEYVNGKYSFDDKMKSIGKTFFAAYNMKNDKNCVKLIGGYTKTSIEYSPLKFDFSGVLLGIKYSRKVYENESVIINPGLGISIGFMSLSGNNTFTGYADVENPRSLSLDLKIVPKLSNNVFLVIDPLLSKDLVNSNNSLIVGINLGLLFNVVKK